MPGTPPRNAAASPPTPRPGTATELLIVSNGITYDGTLPQQDLSNLSAVLDRFSSACEVPRNTFSRLTPADETEAFRLIQAAAQQAVVTFPDHKAQDGLDTPLPAAEAERFAAELRSVNANLNGSGSLVNGIVREMAEDLQKKSFRGSKCLAGLTALGRAGMNAAERYVDGSGLTKEVAVSALINRFRFFYVRNLSYSAHDVYVPANRWRGLSEQQALTFQEFVRGYFERSLKAGEDGLSTVVRGSEFLQNVSLPPLGLYALMATREKGSPQAVAKNARRIFQEYGAVFREFWRVSREAPVPEGGWGQLLDISRTGNRKLDKYHDDVLRLFRDKFGAIKMEAYGRREPSLTRRFIVPVLLGAASGVTTALTGGLGSLLMAAVGGAGAGVAKEEAMTRLSHFLRGHVDQYRELDRILLRDPSSVGAMSTIEAQVEHIFGRRLTR
jgi:hypothetical protein